MPFTGATLAITVVPLWGAVGTVLSSLGLHLADLAESIGRAIGGPGPPP